MRGLIYGMALALILLTMFVPQYVGHALHALQIDFMIGWDR